MGNPAKIPARMFAKANLTECPNVDVTNPCPNVIKSAASRHAAGMQEGSVDPRVQPDTQ